MIHKVWGHKHPPPHPHASVRRSMLVHGFANALSTFQGVTDWKSWLNEDSFFDWHSDRLARPLRSFLPHHPSSFAPRLNIFLERITSCGASTLIFRESPQNNLAIPQTMLRSLNKSYLLVGYHPPVSLISPRNIRVRIRAKWESGMMISSLRTSHISGRE